MLNQHPVLMARQMLETVSHILSVRSPISGKDLWDQASKLMFERMLAAVHNSIITTRIYPVTIKLLQCVALEQAILVQLGHLTTALDASSRAIATAQHLGPSCHSETDDTLPVLHPDTRFDGQYLYNQILRTGRRVCLLLDRGGQGHKDTDNAAV